MHMAMIQLQSRDEELKKKQCWIKLLAPIFIPEICTIYFFFSFNLIVSGHWRLKIRFHPV